MEWKIGYTNLIDRQIKVEEQEAKGLKMLHDDFDADWKSGDEPHGIMTFTDVMPPVTPVEPSEIDLIKADIDNLKARIGKLEQRR